MQSVKLVSSVASILMVLAATVCAAQDATSPSGQNAARILPPPVEVSSPFAMDAPASQRADSIAFLAPASMTAQDRDQLRGVEPSIHRQAAIQGFDLDTGNWNYQQIACPVLPEHILLLYTRDDGIGNVSEFSAILPRQGNGPVQVLPILRRSYSLYTPARKNPITIAAFNIVRRREHPDRKVDWLATGLCYAALTGARVQLPPTDKESMQQSTVLVMNSLLQVEGDGAAVVRFFNVADPRHVDSWALTFDRQGELLNVDVTPLASFKPTMLP